MIRKVKFNNFYSFRKTQEINFLASKKKTYDYFKSKSGVQITKIFGVIGSNASGKTNVMRLFSFLAHFICTSYKNENLSGFHIASKTFFNNNKSSDFSLEFENEKNIFFYDFSIKENLIISEKLEVKEIIKGSHKKNVFVRNLNIIESNKDFFDASSMSLLKNIRSDVSAIAYLKANFNISIINSVFDDFIGFKTNINEIGNINGDWHKNDSLRLYLENPSLKKTAESIICGFDLGLSGFKLEKQNETSKNGEGANIKVVGFHKVNKKQEALNFNYESSGTKQLIFFLAYILFALKNNKVVIIDEIETGLHPEAVNKIISYFIEENKNGRAQLIFSSHSFGFMNKLDMHQISLVEKNNNSESFIYKLNQIDGVRTDDNFLSKYMSGSYGSFPNIKI